MSITWVILVLVTWVLSAIAYVYVGTWEIFLGAGIVTVIHSAWSIFWEDERFSHQANWTITNLGVWLTMTFVVIAKEQAILYTAAVVATAIFAAAEWAREKEND